MQKIKSKDEVIVLTGKDKGKRGTVQKVLPNDKVVVSGVNIAKKHQKPNPNREIVGGIINKEMPLHISNIAIYNKETGKKDKVGFITKEGQGKGRVRIYKSTQKEIA